MIHFLKFHFWVYLTVIFIFLSYTTFFLVQSIYFWNAGILEINWAPLAIKLSANLSAVCMLVLLYFYIFKKRLVAKKKDQTFRVIISLVYLSIIIIRVLFVPPHISLVDLVEVIFLSVNIAIFKNAEKIVLIP